MSAGAEYCITQFMLGTEFQWSFVEFFSKRGGCLAARRVVSVCACDGVFFVYTSHARNPGGTNSDCFGVSDRLPLTV